MLKSAMILWIPGRQGKAALVREHFASLKSIVIMRILGCKMVKSFRDVLFALEQGFPSYYLHGRSAAHPHGEL